VNPNPVFDHTDFNDATLQEIAVQRARRCYRPAACRHFLALDQKTTLLLTRNGGK
jgi:hypothetical protein